MFIVKIVGILWRQQLPTLSRVAHDKGRLKCFVRIKMIGFLKIDFRAMLDFLLVEHRVLVH